MARKILIQREWKREKLKQKYHLIRRSSKKQITKVPSLSDKWEIHGKLQSPPRNSAPIRLHRRCFLTELIDVEAIIVNYFDEMLI